MIFFTWTDVVAVQDVIDAEEADRHLQDVIGNISLLMRFLFCLN